MAKCKYYWRQIKKSKELYLLFAFPLAWYIIFNYVPIYGLQIAFKRYNPTLGIAGSPWIGFHYFKQFFNSYYCFEVIWNTVKLSLYTLAIGFPVPILLALLINEIQSKKLSKTVQNITYMTNFLSVVVIVSMLNIFSDPSYGLFNKITGLFGAESVDFMAKAASFSPLYVLSNVWQFMGFNAIIYIAALAAIDPTYYEAASIDGASRFQKIIHISVPCIMTTIIIMFILRIGNLMTVGFEKVLLMQNSVNTSTSEIISTFIYKNGIQKGQFGYSTAVGLINSVINFILLISANTLSKKTTKTGLW
ncbi:carbohydrate ABC transporter membrane protein 1, CUT1 family (TC 3.A.1.1.-) [Anaerocolumna jejuensis DSM 15929]|uniref:Carbohydrate ABC transporter membrane protein 1, CUT1 family (TC 3.A.1.1.-) n=1 Tax=Anaerocolumna jejuensis DSM 15929 TaxID=1121322 RepID=A0A1M7AGZ7_9FIRM|nr:ABC transporter permease subunit [Anaerocolumna jejuensis]SHL42030.1 carbohydrate ABC transporter membrane protein 1, CUT1 family (TC 3.A.1.1.-) [Anaerocolumna jejuensis DSM 15929]